MSDSSQQLPFIISGSWFKISKWEGDKFSAECQNCPRGHFIKGSLKSTSNLLTHITRVHPTLKDDYTTQQQQNAKKRRLDSGSAGSSSVTKFVTIDPVKSISRVDRLIMEFVINGMHPFSIVSQQEFQNLVKGLDPNGSVMSRTTLVRRTDLRFRDMVQDITKTLGDVDYLCMTTDAWTCKGKSRGFLGMTIHWITNNLERRSAAIACRRFTGSHTYDRIAILISQIIGEYQIPVLKIVKGVTDNGSNFVKAFKQYEVDLQDIEESDEDIEDTTNDMDVVAFESLTDVVQTGLAEQDIDPEIVLPPHHRCSSHTLALICTTDVNSKTSRLQNSAFGKCYALWNKTSRSTQCAEKAKEICGIAFIKPCSTRWNSLYDSLQGLLKQRSKIAELCTALKIPQFQDKELDFIEEYCTCVKPIAEALDWLQGENHTFYGELIPTLITIEKKLLALQSPKPRYCDWLPQLLLEGLRKRFQSFFDISIDNTDAVLAAISHPYFKMRWIPQDRFDQLKNLFVEKTCAQLVTSSRVLVQPLKAHEVQSNVDKFFLFEPIVRNDQSQESQEIATRQECIDYLKDTSVNIDILHKYPAVKNLFIKFNTPLPSSGPVERLFNYSNMILSPNRLRLSDHNFEMLTLLKVNKC